MRTFTATSAAPAEAAWRLLARPEEWATWSPHVRGARGLGRPEVHGGARGAALLLGVLPVPVRITAKRPGAGWDWSVAPGLVRMAHHVEPLPGGGCEIALELSAPVLAEPILAVAYGPLIKLSLDRLARAAERVVGAPAKTEAGAPAHNGRGARMRRGDATASEARERG